MHVIWHQYVCMNSDLELLRRFPQPSKKNDVVIYVAKDQLLVVAPLNDMVRLMGNNKSRKPGHNRIDSVLNRTIKRIKLL